MNLSVGDGWRFGIGLGLAALTLSIPAMILWAVLLAALVGNSV